VIALPRVRHVEQAGATTTLTLDVDPALPFFPDHFPRCGLLPGVVQVGWAVHFARTLPGSPLPATRLSALKFQHPIRPGQTVTLTLTRAGADVAFAYAVDGRACASGRIGA
jgi:3-hydroxymyristoyl/3-hydroxydecanoyl-(acyl carrier protein) dehydratase